MPDDPGGAPIGSEGVSQFETLGLADLTASSVLKHPCNSTLWFQALRLEYAATPRQPLNLGGYKWLKKDGMDGFRRRRIEGWKILHLP